MNLKDIIDSIKIVPNEPNHHSGFVKIIKVTYPGDVDHWAVTNGNGDFLLSKDILEFRLRPSSGDGQAAWDDFRQDCYFSSVIDALNDFKRYLDDNSRKSQLKPHYLNNFNYDEIYALLNSL